MKRNIKEVPRGAGLVESLVTIVGDPCPSEGVLGFAGFVTLLQTLVDAPDLLREASDCPSAIRLYHNGTAWVCETSTMMSR